MSRFFSQIPMNRAISSLIVVNPAKSNRAMLRTPSRTSRRTPQVFSESLVNFRFVKIRAIGVSPFSPNESRVTFKSLPGLIELI